jgi:hypothetical protein
MIRRILTFALIAVFAGVLAGGCSETQEETIENTTRDYYSAYNAEDWDMCLGHIYDTNNVGASVIQSALQQSRAATGEVTVVRVENVSISGTSATADVTLSWAGNTAGETQKGTFVKKGGVWKISYQIG